MSRVVTLAEQIAEEVNKNFNGNIAAWTDSIESLCQPTKIWIGKVNKAEAEGDNEQSITGTGSGNKFATENSSASTDSGTSSSTETTR